MTEAKSETNDSIKDLEFEGYKFTVNTDLLDDVEAFDIIDRIENKGQVVAVVPFIEFLIGQDGYKAMKEHFAAKDAAEHKDEPGYKGKFRVSKLSKIYETIIENFNPKD